MGPTTRALFAEVYARPEDDAPRLVLADHLLELGDPRGEFLALQLAKGKPTPSARRKEKALLEKHRVAWLGPLAEVVNPYHHVFRRGFLAEVMVDFGGRTPPPADEWATVERLRLRGVRLVAVPALLGSPFRALREIEALDAGTLEAMVTQPEAYPRLTTLSVDGLSFEQSPGAREAVRRIPALPLVDDVSLTLNRHPWTVEDFAWVYDGDLVRRLRRLEVRLSQPLDVAGWREAIEARAPDLQELVVATGYFSFVFQRGPDASLSALRVLWHGVTHDARHLTGVTAALRGLPLDALTSFALDLGETRFSPNQLAPLRNLVERQTRLSR